MKKNINTIAILFVNILLFTGCKKEETKKEFTDSPIIEAYLNAGKYFTVKIGRQIPFESNVNYSTDNLNNLSITVEHNNSNHVLTSLSNGTYIDSLIIVSPGDNYNLSFIFNSKKVSAYTYIPTEPSNVVLSATSMTIEMIDFSNGPPAGGPPEMPDPITITWNNPDNSSYLIVVENLETTLDPVRDFGDNEPPANVFRKSPTNLNTEEISSMDFQYYGTHRIILYHVLPDYASLYDDNSTSSQNLINPSTSIINGYGIFTGLNSDTVFVEIEKP